MAAVRLRLWQICRIILPHRSLWACLKAMCRLITLRYGAERGCRPHAGRTGSKDYGALSLAVQYYAEPYIVANVPPNCFIPRPNVGLRSSV